MDFYPCGITKSTRIRCIFSSTDKNYDTNHYVKGEIFMNTVQLVVSVRRFNDYDPLALCSFIEHWATSNHGRIKVSIEERKHRYCLESNQGYPTSELLFLKVDYDNYPTTGNYLIEIRQFIKSAAGLFKGIECIGINAA